MAQQLGHAGAGALLPGVRDIGHGMGRRGPGLFLACIFHAAAVPRIAVLPEPPDNPQTTENIVPGGWSARGRDRQRQ
jgi:hypothetical protein